MAFGSLRKQLIATTVAVAGGALFLAGCSSTATDRQAGSETNAQYALYTDNWTGTTYDLPDGVTVAVVAFGNIGNDGTATFAGPNPPESKSGTKMLLSFGGENATWGTLTNDKNIKNFAKTATAVAKQGGFDGIDLDIEDITVEGTPGKNISSQNVIDLVKQMRVEMGKDMILTTAPQSPYLNPVAPTGGYSNSYMSVLNEVGDQLDYVMVQYYNNPPLQGSVDGLVQGYKNWADPATINGVKYVGVDPSKLLLGVPATPQAAGSGYVDPATLNATIAQLRQLYPNFGGVMSWDNDWDLKDNRAFTNGLLPCLMDNDCGATPTSSPTTESPSPSPTPTVSPTGTPTPSGNANTLTTVTENYGTGYCATVDVSTTSTTPITWKVSVPVGGTVTTAWDANYKFANGKIEASGVSWNDTVTVDSPQRFGFCANGQPL